MRASLFIGMMLLITSCTQRPSTPDKKLVKEETTQGWAKFEFQEDLYDFGRLNAGEIATYSFPFKNIGVKPLVITKADADCGCVQVVFPKEPVEVGATAYLEVTFNSSGEVGREYKTITIVANTEKIVQLHIIADVKNELIDLNN